jgi:dTDP-4-dehydrorhamnose reductase
MCVAISDEPILRNLPSTTEQSAQGRVVANSNQHVNMIRCAVHDQRFTPDFTSNAAKISVRIILDSHEIKGARLFVLNTKWTSRFDAVCGILSPLQGLPHNSASRGLRPGLYSCAASRPGRAALLATLSERLSC